MEKSGGWGVTSRRSETGRHDWNSGAARKLVMNCEQAAEVKFAPMSLSKGRGSGPVDCAGAALLEELGLGADDVDGVGLESGSSLARRSAYPRLGASPG